MIMSKEERKRISNTEYGRPIGLSLTSLKKKDLTPYGMRSLIILL